MSYPEPPQQPQWQPPQPGQPAQGFPPHQGGVPGQPPYPAGGTPGGPPPGGPPPGGPYPGGNFPGGQLPPSGGGRNRWLIPSAIAVAGVVMASTVWATVALVDFGGPQPESVLPASAAAFAKVDLSIDGSQAIELLRFVDQLPDEITEEIGEPDGDMTETFAEGFTEVFPDARQSEVEEWIGQRVGVAVWPTDATDEGVAGAFALAVTDERLAEETLSGLGEDDVAYEVVDGFVLLSDSDSLDDLQDQMEEFGPLERDGTFSSDMSGIPSGSLAAAWGDGDALMELDSFAEGYAEGYALGSGGGDVEDLSGRMTASLRVDGDYLEARTDFFDFTFDDTDLAWLSETPGAAVDAMGTLPEDTVIAVGADGLDQALTEAYENEQLPLSRGERTEIEREFNSFGVPLPESLSGLLGSSTAFGITSLDPDTFFGPSSSYYSYGESGANEEIAFEYRAVGGDEQVLSDLIDEAFSGAYSTPPGVSTDGDTVLVSRGTSSTGVLADDPVFQQTMQDMDEAVLAGFFDLRQVVPAEDVADPDQWGAVGLALSVTEEGRRGSLELRWSPSAGE
ncbi:hypothetical protein [Nocardiopsis sp. FIRDI 009]|uniref:hypothetical protein n=1 Tax=Nocardiopsis sp. FIRDI 009 TaxID=714197 RepID=UPI000E2562FA|nr:hypothetical protein [Nocardiopsis sp. FIRDI 009]